MTTRGQVVAVVLLALLIVGVSAVTNLARSDADTSYSTLAGSKQVSVTVQPGDTLFAIAQRILPTKDPTVVVAVIKSVNSLSAADAVSLQPGQRLQVPTG